MRDVNLRLFIQNSIGDWVPASEADFGVGILMVDDLAERLALSNSNAKNKIVFQNDRRTYWVLSAGGDPAEVNDWTSFFPGGFASNQSIVMGVTPSAAISKHLFRAAANEVIIDFPENITAAGLTHQEVIDAAIASLPRGKTQATMQAAAIAGTGGQWDNGVLVFQSGVYQIKDQILIPARMNIVGSFGQHRPDQAGTIFSAIAGGTLSNTQYIFKTTASDGDNYNGSFNQHWSDFGVDCNNLCRGLFTSGAQVSVIRKIGITACLDVGLYLSGGRPLAVESVEVGDITASALAYSVGVISEAERLDINNCSIGACDIGIQIDGITTTNCSTVVFEGVRVCGIEKLSSWGSLYGTGVSFQGLHGLTGDYGEGNTGDFLISRSAGDFFLSGTIRDSIDNDIVCEVTGARSVIRTAANANNDNRQYPYKIEQSGGGLISNYSGSITGASIAAAIDIENTAERTAFESGDKLIIWEAGVGNRRIDYDDLPAGTVGATISVGTINEYSSGAGVTVDGALIKDGGLTLTGTFNGEQIGLGVGAGSYAINTSGRELNFANGDTNALLAGTSNAGDFYGLGGSALLGSASYAIEAQGPSTFNDVWIDGKLSGINCGKIIFVNDSHDGATDTRTSLNAYDPNRPFVTLQAAVDAAVSGDIIKIFAASLTENITVTNKDLSIVSGVGATNINGQLSVASDSISYGILSLYRINLISSGVVSFALSDSYGTVRLYGCSVSSGVGAFTQSSANHLIDIRDSIFSAVGGTTVIGTVVIGPSSVFKGSISGSGTVVLDSSSVTVGVINPSIFFKSSLGVGYFDSIALGPVYDDDGDAELGGVAVGSVYRQTGGAVVWRQA